MPRNSTPKYCLHRRSGQAVVTLPNPLGGRGRDVYLGLHGSEESHRLYAKTIAKWKAEGKVDRPSDITVDEVIALYAEHCKGRYSRGRRLAIAAAMKPLQDLYGPELAATFDGPGLMAIRVVMVETHKWCRNTVNEQVRWIRSLFKWAVAHKHVPASLLMELQQVQALRPGEFGVKETEAIQPVHDEAIDAIYPHCYQVCWYMVRLQRLTAMRPSELCTMRPIDIDMSKPVWRYRPAKHKNQHRGMERMIPLGADEQELIRPFLASKVDAYVFNISGRRITSGLGCGRPQSERSARQGNLAFHLQRGGPGGGQRTAEEAGEPRGRISVGNAHRRHAQDGPF